MLTKLISPILYVKNIVKSKDFYVNNLGFTVDQDEGNYVSLKLGSTEVALNTADKPEKSPGHQTIILQSSDIEKDYEIIKSSGVGIRKDLVSLSWGKTFAIEDLDGNKIEIIE